MSKISKKEIVERMDRLESSLSFILQSLEHHHFNLKAIIQALDKAGMIPVQPTVEEGEEVKEDGKEEAVEAKETEEAE